MKRIEFITREFQNFVQVREVETFSLYMLNGIVMIVFFYPVTDSQEIKQDVIEFKVIEL